MTATPSNPFQLEAVATYGQVLTTCRDLRYMQDALEQLNEYLGRYFPSTSRYGGAIGLRGGHGSGKTHLLNWLSQEGKGRLHIKPTVVYAKADNSNFFDLYLQFMESLPREAIQELISDAMKKTAKAEVQKALATESLAEQIDAPDGLAKLADEGEIDLNQLLILMNEKLKEQVPSDIPRVLLLVNSSSQGNRAYEWLLGKDIDNLDALGLRSALVAPSKLSEDNSARDIIAINAMEALAALSQLAGRPFMVMVDQLEVLFQVDTSGLSSFDLDRGDTRVEIAARRNLRQQVVFSAIKKMIEQLGRQNALTFIAGNNESWDILPRDVTPRMRVRDPLAVGNLRDVETQHLLEEYVRGLPSHFSSENIKDIQRLSGGNPREIIRIAYYAYEAVSGNLSQVTEDLLVKSANQSGSVADRNRLALATAANVFRRFGDSVLRDLDIDDGVSLDLLLKDKGRPIVALVTMKATDKLSEVNSAKRLNIVRTYLEKNLPETDLIVVAVGYSSGEIQNLLSIASTVLQFEEATFANSLLTRVTELATKQRPDAPSKESGDPAVLKLLEGIAARLNGLETERSDEVKKIAERFAERTRASTEPERQQRELRTRWDLLSVIDDLQKVFLDGWREREHELIKAILIANESQLKLKQVDHIGGLYLDALAEEENLQTIMERDRTGRYDEVLKYLSDYRKDVIAELRRLLRGSRAADRLMEHPWRVSLGAAACFSVMYWIFYILMRNFSFSAVYFFYSFIERTVPVFFVSAAMFVFATFYVRWIRFYRWDRALQRIRRIAREI